MQKIRQENDSDDWGIGALYHYILGDALVRYSIDSSSLSLALDHFLKADQTGFHISINRSDLYVRIAEIARKLEKTSPHRGNLHENQKSFF